MSSDMKTFLASAALVLGIGAASAAMGPQAAPPPSGQSSSASAALPSGSANRPSDYVVGSQDVLKITVFDEPTMSGTYRIDSDGSFQYPMLGRVAAGGRSVRDIEQMLKSKLEDGFIK